MFPTGRSRADALEALKRLTDVTLDDHKLEMKLSTKVSSAATQPEAVRISRRGILHFLAFLLLFT